MFYSTMAIFLKWSWAECNSAKLQTRPRSSIRYDSPFSKATIELSHEDQDTRINVVL